MPGLSVQFDVPLPRTLGFEPQFDSLKKVLNASHASTNLSEMMLC